MKFTIVTAAALVMGAALSTAANADINWGPAKNGTQCWKYSFGSGHHEFGYWDNCPAPAAAPVAHHAPHHHQKKS
jgi:hypothetical protein